MANQTKYFKTPFAESGTRAEVPNNSVGGAVGFDTGFGPDYELPQGSAGRKRIERDKYNGLHHSITKNLKQWQENLYPTWIEDDGTGVAFSYQQGMIVNHAGQDWISNEDANQEEPGVGVKWKVYSPITSLQELSGLTEPSDLDQVYHRSFPNVDTMVSYQGLQVGQRYSTGGTLWRINGTSASNPLTFVDLGGGLGAFPITDVLADDFGADNKGDADSSAALNLVTSYKFKVKLSAGVYKIDSQWTIADLTCESVLGKGKGLTSVVSTQTTGVAMLVETFYTRSLAIEEFTLRNSNTVNTATGLKVQTTFGSWGGAVSGRMVNITGFYGICLHLVGAFNVTMHDCLLQCLSDGTDTKGTILRTDKSSGTFGNQCSFTNTVFWGARIGIDNQGVSPLAFRSCTFEALNLFNTSPAVTGLSIIQSYYNCWFENIQKGLVNCEIDYGTLLPINISTTKSSILRFEFTSSIVSGTQPTQWLNASVEPYYVNNFTATHGLRETLKIGAYQNKFEFSNGEDPTNPALRLIAQNVNVGSVAFRDNVLKHGVIVLIVRATGLNGATMSAIFETSTYGTSTSLIGVVRDDNTIGSDYKLSAGNMDGSLNVTVRAYGQGVHNLEVLYSSIS